MCFPPSQFTTGIVESRKQDKQQGKSKMRKDLLDLFMDHRFSDGSELDNSQLKDTTLNLLIAGRDTTAEALSWMSWHLLADPSVYQTVQEEIDDKNDQGDFEIDYDDVDKHTVKLGTFYETLRLHPSIPKNIRRAVADDVLPNGGPRIQKGDIVLYSDWAMARNTDIWGEDAAEFLPQRWLDESGSIAKVSQFKAHFFNAGPRLCLGQKLATFEVLQLMNVLFGKFNVELVELGGRNSVKKDVVPEYLNSLTHPMKRPLMVRVQRRE